ncbi:MAG: hypothetical protein U5L09_03450 [Bacteroidales bacterium]|nr:hypothetical protein [Bacteroidales bacterium]
MGQRISWKSIVGYLHQLQRNNYQFSTRGRIHNMQFDEPVGVIPAVGSAFIWAIYWLINMKDHRDTTPKLTLNFLFGLIYISLYLIIIKGGIEIPSLYGLLGGIYVGIFELGLTFIIWLQGCGAHIA